MAYLPLSTANLPEPTISPVNDAEPRDYFETFLYSGNGGGQQVGDVIKKPADTTTISNSLVFNGSSEYLSHTTSGTSSGQDQITVSFWIKNWKLDTSTFNHIWSALQGGSDLCFYMAMTTTHTIRFYFDETPSGSVGPTYFDTPMAFTDTSRWYHVHLKVDLNQSTTAEKYRVWIDGVEQTFSYTVQGGVQETNVDLFQNGTTHNIGRYIGNSSQHLGMYLAELHAVDGTAHDPTDFGNFDANGIWIPKTVTGLTYGTNGFYLDFSDNTSTTTLGEDQEGSNDWTLNGFVDTSNQVSDSPTDNHVTWAPYFTGSYATLTEGNLTVKGNTSADSGQTRTTIPVIRGKFYAEFTVTGTNSTYPQLGIMRKEDGDLANNGNPQVGTVANSVAYYSNGSKYIGGTGSTYGASVTTNDIVSIALDADNGAIYFAKNGQWADGAGNSNQTFANAVAAFEWESGISHLISVAAYNTSSGYSANFGQRSFTYTPPTGFLALSENNITVDDQNLESPDFVWIKSRGAARHHGIWDSVRGAGKLLQSSSADAETDRPYGVLEFNTNGFTLGPEDPSWHYNEPGIDEVAWCWKAGTSFSNGVGENGATIASSGKVNTESGFSIVSYTGDDAASATVGHGLSQAPEMVIVKNRQEAISNPAWPVYHSSLGATKFLDLQTTAAQGTATSVWNDTAPTSSLVTIGTADSVNSGSTHIMYCFHSVEGFSKFGSFIGDGSTSASGPFVYLGFRPAFVILKPAEESRDWRMYDSKRNSYNRAEDPLQANTTAIESNESGTGGVDFLSNGFKVRTNNPVIYNSSTKKIIYMAFAENPFKYSNAR